MKHVFSGNMQFTDWSVQARMECLYCCYTSSLDYPVR